MLGRADLSKSAVTPSASATKVAGRGTRWTEPRPGRGGTRWTE